VIFLDVVIVDDEINAVNEVCELLKKHTDLNVKKVFTDSSHALSFLTKNKTDILFVDIEMPVVNGILIAQVVKQSFLDTKICFITAYDEYAVKAFEINATDYILKPCSQKRFDDTVEKLINTAYSSNSETDESLNDLDIVCGFLEDEVILINYSDIYFIEKLERKILIHTKDKVYDGNKPLRFYEERLNKKKFFRCHKCYLVNLKKINKFVQRINYTYDMIFKDYPKKIPLSRQKAILLKRYLNS
jgi:two-component system LytT family response regulator